MKEEKGIALIVLVIILGIVGGIIYSGVKYTQNYIEEQKDEDIKANMLAIQSVITSINNRHTIDEENISLIGEKINLESNETEYELTKEFKETLMSIENANLYILSKEDLTNNGIKEVTVNNKEFYIIDYNSGEIFYSLGVKGKYKLSEI